MPRPALPSVPLRADESTMLVAFLEFYRAALVDRASDLSHEQLQLAYPPTTLTLSRLIGHMAFVEQVWFHHRFEGSAMPEPYASLDWDADADAEMTLAQTWPVEDLLAQFDRSVASSRGVVHSATSLDDLSVLPNRQHEHWSMRWILVHMIEEYARHCGHADLIREAIDGDTSA